MIASAALRRALVATTATLAATGALAQAPAYPTKPMRMIIALAPGGGVDTTGRLLAARLSEMWGQSIVADNRPGAGGAIAAEALVRSNPDGYTVLMASAGMSITPSLVKLPYNPNKDVLPVTMAVVSPGVLVVHPSVPVKTVKELIAYSKSKPGELLFSSSGQGTAQHLTIEMFNQMTGLTMTHVPYKGTAPSITDVVAGRINLTVASVISTRPMFTSGKLRALAVVGGKRTPALPEFPTVAEAANLPGFGVENWYAVFLPGATNKAIAIKMQEAITKIVTEPETRKMLLAQGLDAVGSTQEEFAKVYADEIVRWGKVVRAVGITAK